MKDPRGFTSTVRWRHSTQTTRKSIVKCVASSGRNKVSLVRKVKKNTALNPVARAIAKEKMKEAVTTQRIAIFFLDDDEVCADTATVLALPIYALMISLERIGELDSGDARKLKSGCKVLGELSERGFKWRKSYAITIDNSLEICQRRWVDIPPKMLNDVLHDLESV